VSIVKGVGRFIATDADGIARQTAFEALKSILNTVLESEQRPSSAAHRLGVILWSTVLGDHAIAYAIGKRHLQDNAPDIGFEWPMKLSRGTACVMPGFEPHIKCLVVETTADNENLFGVRMRLPAECTCISPRKKSRQPGVFTRDQIETQGEFLGHLLKPFDRCPATPMSRV
jgi:hypothetical protein